MTVAVDRRHLLRGRIGRAAHPLRPPYARAEAEFRRLCDGCDACRDACPENVIARDAHGFPTLTLRDAACIFCEACSTACPTGALDLDGAAPWTVRATIASSCLSFNGIVCRACAEHCEPGAIRFKPLTGGRALPLVDEGACYGCLQCAPVCPNGSIEMRAAPAEEIAA